jgi:hypothetical protein
MTFRFRAVKVMHKNAPSEIGEISEGALVLIL